MTIKRKPAPKELPAPHDCTSGPYGCPLCHSDRYQTKEARAELEEWWRTDPASRVPRKPGLFRKGG